MERPTPFFPSAVGGVFMVKIATDPKENVRKLGALCRADPQRFQYTYHWIPIERWCSSTIEETSGVVKEFAKRIKPDESWKMEIHKRFYRALHMDELTEKLAHHVNRPKVDLKNPQKTIRIEIVGSEAGLTLLGPKEHLSVNKVKAEALTKAEHS
ncbi:MAG: THUMP domain-containing protein [Candidatus Bathyarchaeia archaeon]